MASSETHNTNDILLITDSSSLTELTKPLLEQGYTVRVVVDIQAGLQEIQQTRPDLILLCLKGGDFSNAHYFCSQVQEIPIIFILDSSELLDKATIFEAGATDYLTRPVLKAELLARLKPHLTSQTHQRQLQAQVAQHQQTEESLRKLSSAVEQSGSTIVITNLNGAIEFVNPAFTTTTGYTIEEALGNNPRVLKSGYQSAELYQELWATIARGEVWRGELLNRKKNGELYWEFATISPVKNKDGQTTHYLAIKDNITKRKQAEDSLKKAYDDLKQHVNQLSTLNLIVETVATVTDLPVVLDIVVRTVARLFNALETVIVLLNPERTELIIAAQCLESGETANIGLTSPLANNSAIAAVMQTEQAVIIPSPSFLSPDSGGVISYLTCTEEVQSLLILPLLTHGDIIGAMTISTNQAGREFNLAELNLGETIAGQIAGGIENTRLFEQEQQQRQIAESLREVATILNSSLARETVLVKILEQLGRVIHYDSVGIFLQEGDNLVLFSGLGVSQAHIGKRITINGSNPTIARCFKSRQPLIIADVYHDFKWELWAGNQLIRGWMGVPFMVDGEPIGVLSVESLAVGGYKKEDAQVLQTFANQAAMAIKNAELFEAVQQANQRIQDELALARKIQYSLLPAPRPQWLDLEVVCYTQSAREIGGDFYTYHAFSDVQSKIEKYALAVGDVSGKGVSAALLMAASVVQFDASLLQSLSPSQRLAYLDEALMPYTKPRHQNCAMCYVEIEVRSKEELPPYSLLLTPYFLLHIVNAGCIPPYIKRLTGEAEQPELGGFALGQGLGASTGYQQITLPLSKGELVILTSDGVVEANSSTGELLGFERLMQIVRQGPLDSAEAMLAHVKQAVLDFTGDAEQHDDMTIVVVRV